MYLCWWWMTNHWKEIKYWKSHETYIKCRSWYVNSNCTERTHSYSCGQQRTAAPARCSSTQQYCGSCVQEAEDSADGQRIWPTPASSIPDAVPRTHTHVGNSAAMLWFAASPLFIAILCWKISDTLYSIWKFSVWNISAFGERKNTVPGKNNSMYLM